jgi:glycerol-3-phosphate O-acyltransferase / dihydroxyacetone phosphate acyltransferase
MFYRIFRLFIAFCLRVYYRETETPGIGSVPRKGPLILVANHGNALLDPLLLLALLPRSLSFLAKHTLFQMPVIGLVTKAIGGLPVYRRQDAPGESHRNAESLEACARILRTGGAVCLFPEGISHHSPRLESLKSGAARMFFRARAGGAAPPVLVPVGINFEAKRAFRSRVLVLFGDPVPVDDFKESDAGPTGVERLTERIEESLRALVPDMDSWEDLEFVRGIKDLVVGGRGVSLSQEAPVLKRFIEAYQYYIARCPSRVGEIRARWKAYRRQMVRFSVTEAELKLAESPVRAARFVLGSALVIGLVLPLAAVGFVVHIVPYLLTGWIERKVNRSPDLSATVKLLAALALFPITYLFVLAFPYAWGGWRAALPGLVVLPLTGWAALMVAERRATLAESGRALFIALPGGRTLDGIRREREAILAEIARLIREDPPGEAGPSLEASPEAGG